MDDETDLALQKSAPLFYPHTMGRQSNDLVRAPYEDASPIAIKLIALIAGAITQSTEAFEKHTFKMSDVYGYNLSVKDRQSALKVFREVQAAKVILPDPTDPDNPKAARSIIIFDDVTVNDVRGTITLAINNKLKDHFIGLNSEFTQYSMKTILSQPNNSLPRMRLLLYLLSYITYVKDVEMPIRVFTDMIGLTDRRDKTTAPRNTRASHLIKAYLDPYQEYFKKKKYFHFYYELFALPKKKKLSEIRILFNTKSIQNHLASKAKEVEQGTPVSSVKKGLPTLSKEPKKSSYKTKREQFILLFEAEMKANNKGKLPLSLGKRGSITYDSAFREWQARNMDKF